jgi:hypothetical protein
MEKALKNKKQFFNTFPTGFENMGGLPQFHRLNNNFLYIFLKTGNSKVLMLRLWKSIEK